MLISREAWQRVGVFDERLDSRHEDLDFCWRARLAGFRVLMTPLARRPPPATRPRRGERPAERHRRSERYYEERAAIVGDAQELRSAVAAVGAAAGDPHRGRSDWRT